MKSKSRIDSKEIKARLLLVDICGYGGVSVLKRKGCFIVLLLCFVSIPFNSMISPNHAPQQSNEISISKTSYLADYTVHAPILITSDDDFQSQGFPGDGSAGNPYVIQGLLINSTEHCIDIRNTRAHFVIDNNLLENLVYPSSYRGVLLDNVTNALITSNIMVHSGIFFDDVESSSIINNTCFGSGSGVAGFPGDVPIIIRNNTIYDVVNGVSIGGHGNVIIEDNTISNATGRGILLQASGSTIVNNTINNSAIGISCEDSPQGPILYNTMRNNNLGLFLETNFENITWNVFDNNLLSCENNGSNNIFEYNYWSDYSGLDADGNNLGDTPYESLNIVDNHPLMSDGLTKESIGPEIEIPVNSPEFPESDDTVEIRVLVTGLNGVDKVILCFYNGIYWTNSTMTWYIMYYRSTIPALPNGTLVYYRIYANDTTGNWVVSPDYSYIVLDPLQTTTTTTTTASTNGTLTILVAGGGIAIIVVIVILFIVKRKRPRESTPKLPPIPPPEEVIIPPVIKEAEPEPEPELPEGVHALRGCAPVGGKYEYKVKVINNTNFVITNIMVSIVAFPEDCMEFLGERTKTINRIEPNAFRSPQFTLTPTKDCVEGQVLASVSYVDHQNNLDTIEVESYTIRSVCDLLEPLESTLEEFELMLADMSVNSEELSVSQDIETLYLMTHALLQEKNFHIISSTKESVNDEIQARIMALALGKYTGKKVAIRITVTGLVGSDSSRIRIEALGDDPDMLPTTIEEIISKFT